MDLDEAILFGQLVNAAYAVAPDKLTNRAGIVPAGLDRLSPLESTLMQVLILKQV
jgi:hypothetical protein